MATWTMVVPVRAVLFDKDGTLFDLHATWDPATGAGLAAATSDDAALRAAAEAVGFDLASHTIRADSVFLVESAEVAYEVLENHVDLDRFNAAWLRAAQKSTTPADGLPDLLHSLRASDIGLAVVTNDWVEFASAQLDFVGWSDLFQEVMGSDSGFGAKPDPDMLLEAARRMGLDPAETLMVGDTAQDLIAGKAAGMQTVLVTGSGATGAATAETKALADIVVSSLGELETVLVARGRLRGHQAQG